MALCPGCNGSTNQGQLNQTEEVREEFSEKVKNEQKLARYERAGAEWVQKNSISDRKQPM